MQNTMERLIEEHNGYLLTSDVVAAGISKPYLADYAKKHSLERVAHGVYMAPDAWPDDYFLLYITSRKIIFSHESALYLHGMTEREPFRITVSVCAGYNATHLRKRGVCVHQIKPEFYDVGRTYTRTNFGNSVAVYDRERTLCDIILVHDSLDSQVYAAAVKEYMRDSHKDLGRLMKYAELFKVDDIVRSYVEVML